MESEARDKLLKDYVPVVDREWYPYKMPSGDWWEYNTRENPEVAEIKFNEIVKYATEDYFFFADNIMRDPYFPHLDLNLHGEMCYIVQHHNNFLMLVPRYHLKSTLGTVYYAIWRLIKNVNTRILIKAATEPVSMSFLGEIKEHIKSNTTLKFFFPFLKPARGDGTREFDMWNKSDIKIDRTRIFKDPSVSAVGALTNITGMRYDQIINDDLMAEENSKNDKTIADIIEGYGKSRLLLAPGGSMQTIGTRKRDSDLYGHMIEELNIPLYKRSAIENEKYIWNNSLVIDKIEEDKRGMSAYTFACEMMNDPISAETSEFRAEYRKQWDEEVVRTGFLDTPPEDNERLIEEWYKTLNIYIGCDPARSKNNRSDYTVILVLGSDKRGREFYLKCIREKLESMEIVDKFGKEVEFWFKNYHLDKCGIETEGGDIHLFQPIQKELRKREIPLAKLTQFKRKRSEDKSDHIRCLQLPWERGLIWLKKTNSSECEAEFLRFPYGKHDDTIDIWAHMHREFIKPRKEKREIKNDIYGYRTKLLKRRSAYNWKVTY